MKTDPSTSPETVIAIEYSYASSPRAKQYGHFSTGCWVLIAYSQDSFCAPQKDLSAHVNKEDAIRAGLETGLPWSSPTLKYYPEVAA